MNPRRWMSEKPEDRQENGPRRWMSEKPTNRARVQFTRDAPTDGDLEEGRDEIEIQSSGASTPSMAHREFLQRIGDKFLLKNVPKLENPTQFQQVRMAWLCPPHGYVAYNITKILAIISIWLTFIVILGKEALPGGNFWGLCIVVMAAMVGEEISKKIKLPGLLGMLAAGFILQNVPGINVATAIKPAWSSALRTISLVIILLRAGLGLDVVVLKRLSRSVALLAFLPSTVEAIAGAVASHYILGFPWIWSFVLGYLLCGVSPAVLVPAMLQLQEIGLGVDKGVPTLLVAGASIENVYAIQLFSVLMSVGFSTTSLTMQILQAPIEIIIALVFGLGTGVLFWYFPHDNHPGKAMYRFVMLLGAGFTAVFGGNALKYSGAGPLACLIMAFVAGYRWRVLDTKDHKEVAEMLGKLWRYFQPVLFGLIGAAVSIEKIQPATIGLGIAVICVGIVVRTVFTIIAVWGSGLNMKEQAFAAIAWSPKATVQATLGSKVYDYVILVLATQKEKSSEMLETEQVGIQMLTIAVLCIVITAPIGALGISLSQNRLLQRRVQLERSATDKQFIVEELPTAKDPADFRFSVKRPIRRSSLPNIKLSQAEELTLM